MYNKKYYLINDMDLMNDNTLYYDGYEEDFDLEDDENDDFEYDDY